MTIRLESVEILPLRSLRRGLEVLMLISIALSALTLYHAFATVNQVQHLQPSSPVTAERFASIEALFAYQTEELRVPRALHLL